MNLVEFTPQEPGSSTRVERFQSLAAGQFWRAKAAVPAEGITENMVLGIISIKWVDEKQHTVVLQAHPSLIGRESTLSYVDDDGKTRQHWVRFDEHRFLTADFLAKFEFEPNAAAIRQREIGEAQAQVQALQQELIEGQRNPRMAEQMLLESQKAPKKKRSRNDEEVEPAIAPLTPEAEAEAQRAFGDGTVANSIGSGLTSEGIASIRQSAARQGQLAATQAKFITEKTTAIAAACQAIAPFYAEQGAMALAGIEDVMKTVKDIQQGVASLDLYVGNGVIVNAITKGASAPRDVKLTICQRKLFMDEELSVHSDVDETFDADDSPMFVETLRSQPSLVAQIFPTERCVLCMQTTRRIVDYGSSEANLTAVLNGTYEQNEAVFLLIRDGENISQVWSAVEGHLKTDNLFPTKAQHRKIFEADQPWGGLNSKAKASQNYREPEPFEGIDGSTIKFEDVAYTDRLAAHERFALHYKRFLILLCGLDHRLKLMGDFYEGPQSMAFIGMAFQRVHFHFLHDEDGEGTLPGVARLPIQEWVAERNAAVRSGSRIVANWSELSDHETAPGACKYDGRSSTRSFWRTADLTESTGLVTVVMDAGELVVQMPVEAPGRRAKRFNARVAILKYKPHYYDSGWMGYLCLDTVDPLELRRYLGDRNEREHFLQYINVFKTALRSIEADRLAEASVRERMLQALEDGRVADGDGARRLIDLTVQTWRADHRGAALPTFDALLNGLQWKGLLDLMYMLHGGAASRVTEILKFFQDQHYDVLRVTADSKSRLIAYLAPLAEERDDRLDPHIWVHRVVLKTTKAGVAEASRKWIALGAVPGGETLVEEWSSAKAWNGLATRFPDFVTKQKIFARIGDSAQGAETLLAFGDEPHFESDLRAYVQESRELTPSKGLVRHANLFMPIGVVWHGDKLCYLGVGSNSVARILHVKANGEAEKKAVETGHVKMYGYEHRARFTAQLRESLDRKAWDVMVAKVDLQHLDTALKIVGERAHKVRESTDVDPLVSTTLDRYLESHGKNPIWLIPEVLADHTVIDRAFGVARDADYHPQTVQHCFVRVPIPFEMLDVSATEDACKTNIFESLSAAFKAGGMSSSSYEVRDAKAVAAYLADAVLPQEEDAIDHRVLVAAVDRPDLPQAPAGVTRWYISPPERLP